jgi:hypothetical protein
LPRAAVNKEDYPALQTSLATVEAPRSDGTASGTYVLAAFVLVRPWAELQASAEEAGTRPQRKSRRATRVGGGDEGEDEWRLPRQQQDEGEEPQAQVLAEPQAQVLAAWEEGEKLEEEEGEAQFRFSFEVSSMAPCCIELAPTFHCRSVLPCAHTICV